MSEYWTSTLCMPIVVRVEPSFHEGLSAGLFQETGSGLQPVHFISRTMTDTEKQYPCQYIGQRIGSTFTKIQDHHNPQATAPTVQRSHATPTENRKMGHGNARCRLPANL